ncbi:MAG: NAD(P)H-dependent glycerol-3-phosphate dehydrogenase [Neisseriaceae bacterium]|nr:MAG: NAD(P)H-dependent glycerol-3-phosphate dehydrogenase [Neisseriaceae bacterium]
MRIIIIGNGSWGTALAIHFSRTHNTSLLTRNCKDAQKLNQDRENKKYLTNYHFPDSLTIDFIENIDCLSPYDLVIIATPMIAVRATLESLPVLKSTPILVASKGFEKGTGLLPHQVVADIYPNNKSIGLLSGPTFAQELASGLPSAICLSTDNLIWGKDITKMLNNSTMRIYLNDDPIGVGVGGAVKNIIAVASGFSDGKHVGNNARAALITRGLAEMTRLANSLGAKEDTMRGLGTLGDLILTCTGNLSRNRQVGLKLAEGKNLQEILQELEHVAEGINTLPEVLAIAKKNNVEMPITEMLSNLLTGKISVDDVVETIMRRSPKIEGV